MGLFVKLIINYILVLQKHKIFALIVIFTDLNQMFYSKKQSINIIYKIFVVFEYCEPDR
jgi:hypothetical protein